LVRQIDAENPDRPCLAAGPKAVVCPDPGHLQTAPAGGEYRRRRHGLSGDELAEIEVAASKIRIQGGRYNEAAERMSNL
jgi:hypothetical protein